MATKQTQEYESRKAGRTGPLPRKERAKKFTVQQIQHQQISWALYVNEGLAANLRTIMRTNSFCLSDAQSKQVQRMLDDADRNTMRLQKLLGPQPGPWWAPTDEQPALVRSAPAAPLALPAALFVAEA